MMKQNTKGCVHIYCGDGKGKTSAGMGLCMRAAGHGRRVLLYQFLKTNETGEAASLARLSTVTRVEGEPGAKFSFQMTADEREQTRRLYRQRLYELFAQAQAYDLLFLDEAVYAVAAGLLDEDDLLRCLAERPPQLEVVLTGQNPGERLIDAADYVSCISKVKHPFDQGQPSREGVEW